MCERTDFLPIGTHVNLILNRLRCARGLLECAKDFEPEDSNGEDAAEQSKNRKQSPAEEREAIERRLRDIAEFERRYGRKT